MPEFTAEVDIDPSEFIDSCSKKEKERLIQILVEDGEIEPAQADKNKGNGVRNPNTNDQIFWESLEHLAKCRDLLSTFEENYINNMAAKYKHLR
jgi:hypothetical protein